LVDPALRELDGFMPATCVAALADMGNVSLAILLIDPAIGIGSLAVINRQSEVVARWAILVPDHRYGCGRRYGLSRHRLRRPSALGC
jgi:hypothetical protein